jgi:hypothetical protein
MRNRDRNRLEREEQRAEEQRRQAEREANCMHWNCTVQCCDWEGRPTRVYCHDCGGNNHITYE